MRWIITGLLATIGMAQAVAADTTANVLDVSAAWTLATTRARVDTPLFMTITNHGDAADSLLRARCPPDIADFTEKHATDRGEGGAAMREVKSFAIPPQETVRLEPGGNHLMLLQVHEPLAVGHTFTCSIVFQKAGAVAVEVKVAAADAKTAP